MDYIFFIFEKLLASDRDSGFIFVPLSVGLTIFKNHHK